MVLKSILILGVLCGCTSYPKVDWPAGQTAVPPPLLPTAAFAAPAGGLTDTRGAALAAEAAALRARAAAIGK